MKRLRSLVRHLDPWAALLLGLLVAMAVIILLAMRGPWNTPAAPPPGPPPVAKPVPAPSADVAVFVNSASGSVHCIAALWVHVDPATPSLSVMVVPPQASGFLPGGGYEPLARIVDDAGPAAGAAALAEMTGVKMKWWVMGGLAAIKNAFPTAFPSENTQAAMARLRLSTIAWSESGSSVQQFARQYAFLSLSLGGVDLASLNIVAFTNYALAAPGLVSNLDLQTAASAAATLRNLGTQPIAVCALPAVVTTTRGVPSWRLDNAVLVSVRQSLVAGIAPQSFGPLVNTRIAPATVVAVIDPLGAVQSPFLQALARRLKTSSGGPVRVIPVVASLGSDLSTAVSSVLERTPAQAVIVALGWGAADPAAAALSRRLSALVSLLRERHQPAVIAALPNGVAGKLSAAAVAAAATAGGLPLSATLSPTTATTSPLRLGDAWAGTIVATVVRACDPELFAPRLASTKLDVTYYERRQTTVAVSAARRLPASASASAAAAAPSPSAAASSAASAVVASVSSTMALLGEFGWQTVAARLGTWTPRLVGESISCHADHRRLALALASDLGLSAKQVVVDRRAPASLIVAGV
ncbi:MAG: hypothetical protein ACLQUT_00055 [Thermoleophilia bacterium]